MKRSFFYILICVLAFLAPGCNTNKSSSDTVQKQSAGNRFQAQSAAKTPNLTSGTEKSIRDPQPLTLTELHEKYRSTFVFNGPSAGRQVSLTFDDVPDTQFTPQILDILKKYNVKATFFVVGNRAEAHPELVKRIVQEGHAIGNHSYSHPNLPKVSDARFHDEVLRTEKILHQLTGYSTSIFRPPYGNINEAQIQWLAGQRMNIINWNVDSLDWEGLNAKQVLSNVMSHVGPGSIILQHGAGGTGENLTGTVQALPVIIERLQAKGIRLVTIPELLGLR